VVTFAAAIGTIAVLSRIVGFRAWTGLTVLVPWWGFVHVARVGYRLARLAVDHDPVLPRDGVTPSPTNDLDVRRHRPHPASF
jgi:hypothetical protein